MPTNGADERPWFLVNEMTIDGCQGRADSALSAGNGNGSAKRQRMASAIDGSPPIEKPNATSGANNRTLTSENKNNLRSPRDNRSAPRRPKDEELDGHGQYVLYNGTAPRPPSLSLSRGCQQGSFPEPITLGQEVPRSMGNQPDSSGLAAYYSNISTNSFETKAQVDTFLAPRYFSKTSLEHKQPGNQGTYVLPKAEDQHGPNSRSTRKKQNAQDRRNTPAAGYRQQGVSQDTEEDAKTDEELSQDPELNESGRREN